MKIGDREISSTTIGKDFVVVVFNDGGEPARLTGDNYKKVKSAIKSFHNRVADIVMKGEK